MNKEVESIISQVRTAFACNVYPGDDNLTVYDPQGREFDETFKTLRGKKWEEFPLATFLAGDTPVPDLTAHAFHYYLPAMLIASLGYTDLSASCANLIAFYLSPESSRMEGEYGFDDTDRFEQRINLLTAAQKQAIRRVLDEYVARHWIDSERLKGIVEVLWGG